MSEPPAKDISSRLNNSKLIRYLLLITLGWALVQILAYFETAIVVFTLAAILSFLLNYPVRWLHRFLPHAVAVGLVFLLSIVIIGGFTITIGLAILSQGKQLISQIPDFFNSLLPLVKRLE